MVNLPIVSRTEGGVGSDAIFQNRVVSADGTGMAVTYEGNAIAAADVGSITCTVYDLSAGPSASTPVATPAISSAAISALTADNLWQNKDTIGRNFLHKVAGATFAKADHTYRVVYAITTTGGTTTTWGHEHTVSGLVPR